MLNWCEIYDCTLRACRDMTPGTFVRPSQGCYRAPNRNLPELNGEISRCPPISSEKWEYLLS
jgi:hypothetical protein